jgi:prolyl-tRNA synthetase
MHATAKEAQEETLKMLNVYADFYEKSLNIPVVCGQKTDKEKFAGAIATYTVEALMHDGKALQGGTSHNFGDGFAKAFGVQYLDKDNTLKPCHQTSWGVTTRMIGAIIMAHGDDNGLVLPPAIAPIQVIIVPIAQHKEGVLEKAAELQDRLSQIVRVKTDASEQSPGWKFAEYEMKGVPLRLEIGPRDMEQNQCVLVRRDTREKIIVSLDELEETVQSLLVDFAQSLFNRALQRREEMTYTCTELDDFIETAKSRPGFLRAMWCGDLECELKMKEVADVTSRCIPFGQEPVSDKCICCGKPATKLLYWGKAY